MSKLILLPDLHLQSKESHYLADIEFLNWLSSLDINKPENTLLQMGDFYDLAKPEPKVVELAIDFFHNKWKGKSNYIMAGNTNHEYDRKKDAYAIQTLSSLSNVNCLFGVNELELDNLKLLAISWFPDNYMKDDKGNNIKFIDYVKDLPEVYRKHYDYILGHINYVDTRCSDYIDLSYLDADNIITAHIHMNFLGNCVANARGQDLYDSYISVIDTITKEVEKIYIPKFLVYKDINYPDKIEGNKKVVDKYIGKEFNQYVIYTVNEAIDKNETINYYTNMIENFYYREVNVKKLSIMNESKRESDNTKKTVKEWLNDFIDNNDIDNKVKVELENRVK